jgi:hypothetical protein
MNFKRILTLLFFILIFKPQVFAISKMSENEMKSQTAQAGISVAVDNAVFYNQQSSIKFIDADGTATPGYLGFKNIKTLTTYNTGNIDLDNDGIMGEIIIDVASPAETDPGYKNPYVSLECGDFEVNSFIKIGEIDFNGKSIGSLDITGAGLPKWNLYFGAHNSGIDLDAGFQFKINSLKFNYGPEIDGNWLGFENLFIADSFTGIPEDPSTWSPSGKFKIGNFADNAPATFDIGTREFDGVSEPVIFISAPMTGSARIENIHIGDKDFGAAAIDGINVHRLTIEMPGRDLGNI